MDDSISRQVVKLKPCPFCGSEAIYETYSQEYAFGTKNPEIFCNSCQAIFSIEDDSPYMNSDEDYQYRKQKTIEAWNRRIVQPHTEADIQKMQDLEQAELEKAFELGREDALSEIVRCKDCKWFGDIGCAIKIVDDSDRPSENDFCSYAERRTDG